MSSIPITPDSIDAVLFDMDGTLIDTDNVDVSRWAHRIARVYGDTGTAAHRPARRIVMALETPINMGFTILDALGLDTPVIRAMVRMQGGGDPAGLPPISGTGELLHRLAARYRLAVVSTRTVAEQRAFLRVQGTDSCFGAFAGRDTTWRIKPHPQPVLYAAEQLGVEPGRCLMVGDTTVDVRAGRRAGAWTCGVLCGYGQRRELERAGAHVILEHTTGLAALLLDV